MVLVLVFKVLIGLDLAVSGLGLAFFGLGLEFCGFVNIIGYRGLTYSPSAVYTTY